VESIKTGTSDIKRKTLAKYKGLSVMENRGLELLPSTLPEEIH
jgi:hypothetical protein